MSRLRALLGTLDADTVVREHGPSVHRHLRRIFGPHVDVDDVFQMTFMEVLRSLPNFRGEAKLSTWIRRITWNVAYQEMRLRYRHQGLTAIDDVEPIPSAADRADDVAERRQAMHSLYGALHELDPNQRMAVVMHDVEHMTLKEISVIVGKPLPTIASRLKAGRARLAEAIKDHRQGLSDRQPSTAVEQPGGRA